MKPNPLFIVVTLFLTATNVVAQNTKVVNAATTNVNTASSTAMMVRPKIVDTTTIKIQKLQEENNKLNQDVAELKETVAKLVTKSNQDHLDLGLAKLSLKTITESLVPTAYAAINPEYDKSLGGYSYKLGKKFGIADNAVQSYNSLTVTLNHNFEETPVILTSVAEDHINTTGNKALGIVTYQFLPPNKIRFTVEAAKIASVTAPFSVMVYGQ